ncbi:hypothetical protein K1719_004522 [Acacia pycnantha]|nr:hypothetical protein K1719_004522 [Acacia pycnantha]
MLHVLGDLIALLDSMAMDEVFLVGHDWGALISWYLCMFRPERVKAFSASASPSSAATLKMILVSTRVLTAALALKHTVPVVSDFIVSECPSIWTFMLTCVRPPYLYILMNCIIISIVASSKLHHQHKLDHTHSLDDPVVLLPSIQTLMTAPVKISEDLLPTEYNTMVLPPSQNLMQEPILISADVRTEHAVSDGLVSEPQVYNSNVQEPKTPKRNDHKEVVNGSDEAKIRVRTSIQRKDSSDLSFQNGNEKPSVSARFGHHRKAVKAYEAVKECY